MKIVAETEDFFADTPTETKMRLLIRNYIDKLMLDAFERELKGVFLEGNGYDPTRDR